MDEIISELSRLDGLVNGTQLRHERVRFEAFWSLITRSGSWSPNDKAYAGVVGLEVQRNGLKPGSDVNQVLIERMRQQGAELVARYKAIASNRA